MKTVQRVVLLIILLFGSLYAVVVDNTANIWIDNGKISRSYHIDNWSEVAQIKNNQVFVNEQPIVSFAQTTPSVLINNTPHSFPAYTNPKLPYLSLVGLDNAVGQLGEALDKPMVVISPNGGEFNSTIEVILNVIAPAGFAGKVYYQIDNASEVSTDININENHSSVKFYIYKNGTHIVKYKLGNNPFQQATFTINSSGDNLKKDTDGDGIPDSVESELGLDPTDGSMQDSDGNGWSDFDEIVRGHNLTDSDGDGWLDWDEVNLRHTDKDNNRSKPTAHSLYGVEYNVTSKAYDGNSIKKPLSRVSFVDVSSATLYDSLHLLDINLSAEYYNIAISPIFKNDLNSSLNLGNIPAIRVPADTPIIQRVQEENEDTNSTWVAKAFIASTKPLSVKDYYSEFNKTTLPNDFNASMFIQGFVDYLKARVVVPRDIRVDKNSSISVALLEGVFKSREDSNRTLLLGNPDFSVVGNAYPNILQSLNLEDRDINSAYLDLQHIRDNQFDNNLLAQFTYQDDGNTTESRLAKTVEFNLDSQNRYKISLMSIVSYAKAQSHTTVWSPDNDSDGDGINNKDEVMPPIYYSNPLSADSDNDGLDDNQDPCINDSTNSCMNDSNAQSDSDGDNISDTIDNCPFVQNSDQADSNGDGIGDACSSGEFAIINPRTKLHILQGEVFTFEAIRLNNSQSTPQWYIDNEPIQNANGLRLKYYFTQKGKYTISIGASSGQKYSIPIEVISKELKTASLNIYAQPKVKEGENNHTMLVELELTKPLSYALSYNYSTKGNDASENTDYIGVSGTVTFQPKEVRKFIPITIVGDTDDEDNESFVFIAQNSKDTNQTTITIIDDDLVAPIVENPLLSVTFLQTNGQELSGDVIEGDIDHNITVRLTLSSPAQKSGTSIHYDYTPETSTLVNPNEPAPYPNYHSMAKLVAGDINFELGEKVKEFNITIIGDTINESNKLFSIRLSEPNNIKLYNILVEEPDKKDVGFIIQDDDPMPTVSFEKSSYTTAEGQQVHVKLILSNKSYQTVEVNLTVDENSTAEDSEDMDVDDYNLSTKHVVILATNPNANSDNLEAVIDINISQGLEGEDDETITLDINSSKNATISSEANSTTITIVEEATPTSLSSHVYFGNSDATHGNELWQSDGIAGGDTSLLKDIIEGNAGSYPQYFTRVGDNSIYFIIYNNDYILYKSDGTAENTVVVHNFADAMIASNLVDVNGVCYLVYSIYNDSGTVSIKLWGSDGTDILLKTVDYFEEKVDLVLSGDKLGMFISSEFIKYDINTHTKTSISLPEDAWPQNLVDLDGVDGVFYFVNNGEEIWWSNNSDTQKSTILDEEDVYVNSIATLNHKLYYATTDKSDNTVHKLFSFGNGSISFLGTTQRAIYTFKVVGNNIYWVINNVLYVYNGTDIVILKTVDNGDGINLLEDSINGELFFIITHYDNGSAITKLWKTDGTPNGTMELLP